MASGFTRKGHNLPTLPVADLPYLSPGPADGGGGGVLSARQFSAFSGFDLHFSIGMKYRISSDVGQFLVEKRKRIQF